MTQGIQKQDAGLSAVKPERHFVQVGREMLRADSVPCANDAALEQRESRFNGVCGDHESLFPADIFFGPVIDGLAFRGLSARQSIDVESGFIGHDYVNIFADVLGNYLADCLARCFANVDEFQKSVTLHDSNYGLLVVIAAPATRAFIPSANVGFVNFDCTVNQVAHFGHGVPDSVAQIPCGLVADSQCALHLVRRESLAGLTEQQRCKEPLLQRQMGVIENRSGGDGELIVTTAAIEELLRGLKLHGWHLAARTFNAVGPAETHKQLAALFIRIEEVYNVN